VKSVGAIDTVDEAVICGSLQAYGMVAESGDIGESVEQIVLCALWMVQVLLLLRGRHSCG
jgi:hypothetical protein